MNPSISVHWKTGTLIDLNDQISEDQIASKSFRVAKSPEFSPVSGIDRILTPANGQEFLYVKLPFVCKAAFDPSLFCQITSRSFCVPWSPEAYAIITIFNNNLPVISQFSPAALAEALLKFLQTHAQESPIKSFNKN